eukprot:784967-Rhodomonas_salina.6
MASGFIRPIRRLTQEDNAEVDAKAMSGMSRRKSQGPFMWAGLSPSNGGGVNVGILPTTNEQLSHFLRQKASVESEEIRGLKDSFKVYARKALWKERQHKYQERVNELEKQVRSSPRAASRQHPSIPAISQQSQATHACGVRCRELTRGVGGAVAGDDDDGADRTHQEHVRQDSAGEDVEGDAGGLGEGEREDGAGQARAGEPAAPSGIDAAGRGRLDLGRRARAAEVERRRAEEAGGEQGDAQGPEVPLDGLAQLPPPAPPARLALGLQLAPWLEHTVDPRAHRRDARDRAAGTPPQPNSRCALLFELIGVWRRNAATPTIGVWRRNGRMVSWSQWSHGLVLGLAVWRARELESRRSGEVERCDGVIDKVCDGVLSGWCQVPAAMLLPGGLYEGWPAITGLYVGNTYNGTVLHTGSAGEPDTRQGMKDVGFRG